MVRETLGAIKRAGADLILTYFAMDIARQGFYRARLPKRSGLRVL